MLARAVVMQRRRRAARPDQLARGGGIQSARARRRPAPRASGPRASAPTGRAPYGPACPNGRRRLSAISRVPKPKRSAAPDSTQAIACSGLMAERGNTGAATSPTAATTSPVGPHHGERAGVRAFDERSARQLDEDGVAHRTTLTTANDWVCGTIPAVGREDNNCAIPLHPRGRLRRRSCGEGGLQPGRDPQSRQRGSASRPRVKLPVPSELKRDA